ncbi:MAG: glucosamine inositolphosphorylceramide transferase family protein [Asticcacaulis sp.]
MAITELWQVGIVHRPPAAVASEGVAGAGITWLPEPGSFRFNADPFGLWQDGHFHVLVEAYDYRTKRGEIHYYSYDRDWTLTARGVALKKPFHLSYPFLIREGDDIYMLPEAHRGGKLTLYRAVDFPARWAPAGDLLDLPAIDATVFQHDGLWWMTYALPGEDNRAMRELHAAYARRLTGPWTPHSANPLRTGLEASRPGGAPVEAGGALYLPMQDCTTGYGVALNLLRIGELTPQRWRADIAGRLGPEGVHPDFGDGLHTLSGDGEVSLIDVKRLDASPGRIWVDLQRRMGRLTGKGS